MDKYYYYINYGSGFVNINPMNNTLELSLVRGEFNDFIQRKKLSGTFSVIGSEAIAAENYYIVSGNLDAPFKIYQNGTDITGTLIYEGVTTTEGLYDYDELGNAISTTFNSFITTDIYSSFLEIWKQKIGQDILYNTGIANSGYRSSVLNRVCFENDNNSINELRAYSFNGTDYAILGNQLTMPTIGRVVGEVLTEDIGVIVFLDTYTSIVRTYQYVSPNWVQVDPDFQITTNQMGNWGMCTYNTDVYAIAESGFYYELGYTGSAWSLTSSQFLGESFRYPSLCTLDNIYYAFIDDSKKELRARQNNVFRGLGYSLDETQKPIICTLDTATKTIACIDEKTGKLRALRYTLGSPDTWSELGFIQLEVNSEPSISYSRQNQITFHDSYTGITEKYTFDGVDTWTKTGNSLTIGSAGDGYSCIMPTVVISGAEIVSYIKSGSMVLFNSAAYNIIGITNKIAIEINDSITGGYGILRTGNGSTIALDEIGLMNLTTSYDNDFDLQSPLDDKKSYSIQDMLLLCELFQQYFYIEVAASAPYPDYDIKFIQPNLFSSIGTDIVVPTLTKELLRSRLYKEEFKINFEKLEFKNELNTDFVGSPIKYNRKTDIENITAIPVTTDFEFYKNIILGIKKEGFSRSGLLMYENENISIPIAQADLCPKNFIFGSTTQYIENSNFSKKKILENYHKDYRFANKGDIDINGTNYDASTFDTCKDIIQYPDVELQLDSFPANINSLDWGGGERSFITSLTTNLESDITTIKSRLLDL